MNTKQAGESLQVQNDIAEIKLRAKRKAGEILREMPTEQGKRTDLTSDQPDQKFMRAGITYGQAARFQKVASIPDEVFEQHIIDDAARNGRIPDHTVGNG